MKELEMTTATDMYQKEKRLQEGKWASVRSKGSVLASANGWIPL